MNNNNILSSILIINIYLIQPPLAHLPLAHDWCCHDKYIINDEFAGLGNECYHNCFDNCYVTAALKRPNFEETLVFKRNLIYKIKRFRKDGYPLFDLTDNLRLEVKEELNMMINESVYSIFFIQHPYNLTYIMVVDDKNKNTQTNFALYIYQDDKKLNNIQRCETLCITSRTQSMSADITAGNSFIEHLKKENLFPIAMIPLGKNIHHTYYSVGWLDFKKKYIDRLQFTSLTMKSNKKK